MSLIHFLMNACFYAKKLLDVLLLKTYSRFSIIVLQHHSKGINNSYFNRNEISAPFSTDQHFDLIVAFVVCSMFHD